MWSMIYLGFKLTHIFAALALFAAEGVTFFSLRELRQAKDFEGVRGALARVRTTMGISKIAPPWLLLSGLVMMLVSWGFQTAWVNLSLLLFMVNFVLVRVSDIPWAMRLGQAATEQQGALTPQLQALIHDPRVKQGQTLRLGINLGLVFLMTLKPGLWLALAGVAVMVALVFAMEAISGRSQGKLQPKVA